MDTILRAVAAYCFLLFIIRVIGRRSIGQMTPFEFLILFFIGGMTIQAIVTDDRSLTNGFLAVTTIALMHVGVSLLKQRFPSFRTIVDGTPIVIFDGKCLYDRMSKLHLQEQDIMAAARMRGLERLDQIRYAVIERNGEICIIQKDGR